MLTIMKKDTFVKDVLLLLLVSILGAALFARGFALATDKYFAKAVTGVMGDFGQYDLLFQTREELKGAMARHINQIIEERFPGATLRSGISLAGKSTFFLTFPSEYKTKSVFNSLDYYFNNLPGNGGFSVMTEPRINITSVPKGVFDFLSNKVEQMPGVKFTFKDGNSIGIILESARHNEAVLAKIKKLLKEYQILEVRIPSGYSQEEVIGLGKNVAQSLSGIKGADYVKDITMAGEGDELQYLTNTMLEVKKFMLAYAAEVKVQAYPDKEIEVGDLLVVNGQNQRSIKAGSVLDPLEVVIKVTAKDAAGIRGLIIQGDASYIRDNIAYQVLAEEKIGTPVATIEVSSRKGQLIYGLDQGIKLLSQINGAIKDYNDSTGGAGLTVSGIEKVYRQLLEIKGALKGLESGVDSLTGKADRNSLTKMVRLVQGVGDDLEFLSKTFARVQVLENRFSRALDGLQSAQFLVGSPLLQSAVGQAGGIGDKLEMLDSQLGVVQESLRQRIQSLDDFINRFNPVVATLLSWRNSANQLAKEMNSFSSVFTPGSANHNQLKELIRSTDQIVTNLTGFDSDNLKEGLEIVSDRLFGSEQIDLSAVIAQAEHFRDSLPKLLDEEIGNSVSMIDKYVGGDEYSGDRIQIFTKAGIDSGLVNAAIRDALDNADASIYNLPAGTINPDIRSELFKILAEVRSTIAALVVVILWVLTFILDQSLVISMLKIMPFKLLPKNLQLDKVWLKRSYEFINKFISPANLYAAVVGGIWLGFGFALAGARIPYLNSFEVGIIGSLLGVLIASIAVKINPVSKDEVMAGLSLGLQFKTIMREIVIPAGRPGVMQILNRWKMVMK